MDNSILKNLFHECMPLFMALGDEVRLSIIEALAQTAIAEPAGTDSREALSRCGLNVRQITDKTNLSRPAISHHLKILKNAGIVDVRREKTSNYYYLTISYSTKKLMELGGALQAFLPDSEAVV